MYRNLILTFFLCLIMVILVYSQGHPTHSSKAQDPRHSVFGPVQPDLWEFQAATWDDEGNAGSAFNFYRKNQRNKTLFMRLMNNGIDNNYQFRVKQITGGIILYPYKDDDRFQIDVGGTYEAINDTSLTNKALFSRITFRPEKNLWFRLGYEITGGYSPGGQASFDKYDNTAYYFAGSYDIRKISFIGVAGSGEIDNENNNRYGGGVLAKGPFNTYFLGGYIKSTNKYENTRTLAIGRWAPFRPDMLPSGFFIWKHRENFDFQLAGAFWGKKNIFVRPAALGMTRGIFISSAALSYNSKLRQTQMMTITDDYRNSDISMFFVYMNQGIEMIPDQINNVGFRVVQLYKLFDKTKFSVFSKPVIGIFYNEETEPEGKFNPITHSMTFTDKTNKFWSYQLGVTVIDRFILNAVNNPENSEWTVALSYIYKK